MEFLKKHNIKPTPKSVGNSNPMFKSISSKKEKIVRNNNKERREEEKKKRMRSMLK